jgi:hypothetical protein
MLKVRATKNAILPEVPQPLRTTTPSPSGSAKTWRYRATTRSNTRFGLSDVFLIANISFAVNSRYGLSTPRPGWKCVLHAAVDPWDQLDIQPISRHRVENYEVVTIKIKVPHVPHASATYPAPCKNTRQYSTSQQLGAHRSAREFDASPLQQLWRLEPSPSLLLYRSDRGTRAIQRTSGHPLAGKVAPLRAPRPPRALW